MTPPINYQALNFWFSVTNFLILAAVGIIGWWNLRDKVATKRFKAAEDRLLQLENDVKHPPSCTYHPRLEQRMDQAIGKIERMDGKLDGLNRAVDLMNEFLINQGGK